MASPGLGRRDFKVLVSQQLAVVDAAVYTVPDYASVEIANGSLCNTTGSAVTVNVSIVPKLGTLGDGTHRVVSGYSLLGNDSLPLKELIAGHLLAPGDVIAASAGTANAVDMVVTGSVYS